MQNCPDITVLTLQLVIVIVNGHGLKEAVHAQVLQWQWVIQQGYSAARAAKKDGWGKLFGKPSYLPKFGIYPEFEQIKSKKKMQINLNNIFVVGIF